MTGLFKNPVSRALKRAIVNFQLRRKHVGLQLGTGVSITGSQFGRFNMICDRTVIRNSTLGDFSYVGINSKIANSTIGSFCSIGPSVTITLGMHPSKDFISTHPVFYSTSFPGKQFATEQGFDEHGTVTIGNDVWIGAGVSIADNVEIGTGAIIATGAVVSRNVEPYSIVGGIPAKLIRMRFNDEQIKTLLDSKWWEFSDDELTRHHQSFYNFDAFEEFLAKRSSGNQ